MDMWVGYHVKNGWEVIKVDGSCCLWEKQLLNGGQHFIVDLFRPTPRKRISGILTDKAKALLVLRKWAVRYP